MGRVPDYNLCVVEEYKVGKKVKYRYTKIGRAWVNESGSISISIVTMPGVKLRLYKNDPDRDKEPSVDFPDEQF